jgi:hypothetical protein
MFSISAPNDPGNSVRNFRIRTYARFRNHAAQARSLFATVRNPYHRRLMRLKNRLSISVISVTKLR